MLATVHCVRHVTRGQFAGQPRRRSAPACAPLVLHRAGGAQPLCGRKEVPLHASAEPNKWKCLPPEKCPDAGYAPFNDSTGNATCRACPEGCVECRFVPGQSDSLLTHCRNFASLSDDVLVKSMRTPATIPILRIGTQKTQQSFVRIASGPSATMLQ